MVELKIKCLNLRIYQIDSTDYIYKYKYYIYKYKYIYIYIYAHTHISEDKVDRLLEKYSLSNLKQRETGNLNSTLSVKEI